MREILKLVLVRMKGCATADKCRGAVEEVLVLVKETKLERLREELGGDGLELEQMLRAFVGSAFAVTIIIDVISKI